MLKAKQDAIVIEKLSYRYKSNDFDSLKEIDLVIASGTCVGLIGANGAGKSTLISILSGLIEHKKGRVCYPLNNAKFNSTIKMDVALVPQEYAFYPQMTVLNNLTFFTSLLNLDKKETHLRIDEVLQQTDLSQVKSKKANALSGGYKRRLNIAIALLKKPKILFLDEPTVGIDPVSRNTIVNLIMALKASNTTIVYTSHMLSEVEQICDDIVILKQGQLSHFSSMNENKILEIKLDKDVIDVVPSSLLSKLTEQACEGQKLLCQPKDAILVKKLLACLSESDCQILHLSYRSQSLNELYLSEFES